METKLNLFYLKNGLWIGNLLIVSPNRWDYCFKKIAKEFCHCFCWDFLVTYLSACQWKIKMNQSIQCCFRLAKSNDNVLKEINNYNFGYCTSCWTNTIMDLGKKTHRKENNLFYRCIMQHEIRPPNLRWLVYEERNDTQLSESVTVKV